MATIVAILGASGDGKTTSTIINPDGKLLPSMEEVKQINLQLQEKELELQALYEKKYIKKSKKEKRNECVY